MEYRAPLSQKRAAARARVPVDGLATVTDPLARLPTCQRGTAAALTHPCGTAWRTGDALRSESGSRDDGVPPAASPTDSEDRAVGSVEPWARLLRAEGADADVEDR